MLRNYLKITFRSLLRHKGYAFINIFGLAIGLACCLLMVLFVLDELSYDRYHTNADRLYRVVLEKQEGDNVSKGLYVPTSLAQVLREKVPEVSQTVRLGLSEGLFLQPGRSIKAAALSVDPSALEAFSFPLVSGDPKTVLAEPKGMVISERIATTYFPDEDPIGEVLTLKFGSYEALYQITGVMKNIPHNTHLPADMLLSRAEGREDNLNWAGERAYSSLPLYLLAAPHTNAVELEEKINLVNRTYLGTENIKLSLQAVPDIHLYSHLERELAPNGDIRYVYIFSVVALLILFIACMNFMNLATARSLQRAKEVGVRKVIGASRSQLMGQFLGESLLTFSLALVLGLLFAEFALPFFNNLIGKSLSLTGLLSVNAGLTIAGVVLLVCLLAGAYPALYLSALNPVFALKGVLKASTLNARMRKGLVLVQFSISVVLIIATLVVYHQLNFISTVRLGFNQEQLLVIPRQDFGTRLPSLKLELLSHSGVANVASASWYPGTDFGEMSASKDPKSPNQQLQVFFVDVDREFLETLQIELVEGRDFSPRYNPVAFPKDTASSQSGAGKPEEKEEKLIMLNQTAVRRLADTLVVGKNLDLPAVRGNVVGVVRDFHGLSLHHKVPPIVLRYREGGGGNLIVRIRPGSIPATVAHLEKTWKGLFPELPLEYFFLDEYLQKLYTSEMRLGKLFLAFASFGIGIACLGLLGLASFMAEQRTKEIGIRKVLGASVPNIVRLLSKDFVKLVLLANLVAWPLAWYAMGKWLEDFAYRIALEWWVFAVAGLLALLIAISTVSFQSFRAAMADPVKSLRSE